MPGRRGFLRACLLALGVPAASRAGAEPATATVEIRDYKFVPETLTIKAGTTVKWLNNERRTTHSVLFQEPGGLESERMFPGDSWQRRFDKPGDYPYTCGPHREMKGRIVVTE